MPGNQQIVGYATLPSNIVSKSRIIGPLNRNESKQIATHAMVFMLSGITVRWKIPVAYYYTHKASFAPLPVIEEISKIVKTAFEVARCRTRGLANDAGSCNQKVWRHLGIELKREKDHPLKISNSFMMHDQKIYVFADLEHIIKNWRCAIFNQWKDGFFFKLSDAIFAKYAEEHGLVSPCIVWGHIYELYKFDCLHEYKYAPRLNKECFEFTTSWAKMCVPTAMAVLSRAVAAGLRMLVKHHNYPADYLTTALFCDIFGKWVNLMNSRSPSFALSYKRRDYNELMEFLDEFMIFTDSIQTHPNPSANYRKDFQKGAILLTTSVKEVAKDLLDEGYDFVLPSRFGSGPCENLFSTIRKKDPAPTYLAFQKIMQCLVITRSTLKHENGTYLNDEDEVNWVTDFKKLKDSKTDPEIEEMNFEIGDYKMTDFSQIQGITFHLGYVLKKTICSVSHCQKCIDLLTTSHENRTWKHSLITEKAYVDGALKLPSEMASDLFENANNRFMENRDTFDKAPRTLDKFIAWLSKELVEKYKEFPSCHLDLLLRRFFKTRMYFLANTMDEKIQNEIKSIRENNFGSRTMMAHRANKK